MSVISVEKDFDNLSLVLVAEFDAPRGHLLHDRPTRRAVARLVAGDVGRPAQMDALLAAGHPTPGGSL